MCLAPVQNLLLLLRLYALTPLSAMTLFSSWDCIYYGSEDISSCPPAIPIQTCREINTTIPAHPEITLSVLSGKRIQDQFTPFTLWDKYSWSILQTKSQIILIFPTINFLKIACMGVAKTEV